MLPCNFVPHNFAPGETIEAIIRSKNHQNLTKKMLEHLMVAYSNENGDEVPRAFNEKMIPVFVGFTGNEDTDDRHR